jgi:hypothetical protein
MEGRDSCNLASPYFSAQFFLFENVSVAPFFEELTTQQRASN